jgi:HAD superfamily hydrolase (TIGR01484 family)
MTARWEALACDYDGTIASRGRVRPATLEALAEVRASRRRIVLVTGRELEDLLAIFPLISLFDRVVAENGALLYNPATQECELTAGRAPRELVAALLARELKPLSVGQAIIATGRERRRAVTEAINELGLDLRIILNKRSLMVLPQGVNKATGLMRALHQLGVAPEDTVGVGDAENDQDFLSVCGYSAAVANAVPALKRSVDLVTSAGHGAGVVELVKHLLNGANGRGAGMPDLRGK